MNKMIWGSDIRPVRRLVCLSIVSEAAGCSKRAIIRIQSNLQLFGTIKDPSIKAGGPQESRW